MLAAVAVISNVWMPVVTAAVLLHTSVTVVAAAPIATGERATTVCSWESGPNFQ
jgi:hypothetical protein